MTPATQATDRPPFESLCGCVTIRCTEIFKWRNEPDTAFTQRKIQHARFACEAGADWLYDADCQRCNQGAK